MANFVNNCVFDATSTGTGVFVVASAVTGYQTPADAGAVDTNSYRYRAQSTDLAQWEIGTTVASLTATSFTRVVTASSAGGTTTVNFTAAPAVALTMFAADIVPFASPAFTGTPTAPTQAALLNSVAIATTEYVDRTTRDKLTANRTYYVRSDGSNSNTGLVNSAGGAFLTAQKAVDTFVTLDLAGYAGTIQMVNVTTPQTYTGQISVLYPFIGGSVTLLGDATTPANLVWSVGVAHGIIVDGFGSAINVSGIKLQNSGGYAGLYAKNGGRIAVTGKIDFGACSQHMLAEVNGTIVLNAVNHNITGSALIHMWCLAGGRIRHNNCTVTVSAALTFSTAFAVCASGGLIKGAFSTWSVNPTGTRHTVDTGGGVDTSGSGTSYFPGTVAGATTTPGWFV